MPRKKVTKTDEYLGTILRHYRTVEGLSQQKLGNKIGITFQQIQKYEKAKNQLSVSLFLEFCKVLKLDPIRVLEKAMDKPTKDDIVRNDDKHRSIIAINAILHTLPDEKIEALKKLIGTL